MSGFKSMDSSQYLFIFFKANMVGKQLDGSQGNCLES